VCDDHAVKTVPIVRPADGRATGDAESAALLRERLAGVRALLLDLDGVLVLKGAPLPGAVEALGALDSRRFPYLIGTNVSLKSRVTLARELTDSGLAISADRIVSAVSTAAALARRRYGTSQLYVMASQDAVTEFAGLRLLSHEEAADPEAQVVAVVVGDAGDDFTPRNMQSAFRMVRNGARLVAMHKNRWWLTPAGVTLDSGAYVAALEFGTQKRSLVTGKPSRAFFDEAVRLLGMGCGTGPSDRLFPGDVAMVGDDLWNDIRGAQKAGLRGIFVRSGKHGDAELARAASERARRLPDAVAPSIAEVVAALPG
jgi:HAD superfamily hydrolase (TIGR01458 family)